MSVFGLALAQLALSLLFILFIFTLIAPAEFNPAGRAMWRRKRMEAIESALSLAGAIDVQMAALESRPPSAETTNSANALNRIRGELLYIVDKLCHYRPRSTAVLLDDDMRIIEDYEKDIRRLQREALASCGPPAETA